MELVKCGEGRDISMGVLGKVNRLFCRFPHNNMGRLDMSSSVRDIVFGPSILFPEQGSQF